MSTRRSRSKAKVGFGETLLGAAVSGLLAGGCGSGETTDDAPRKVKEFQVEGLTVAMFEEMCEERGGLTQVHASCAGNNACRGLILNGWAGETIVEHTCRGFSSCLGISCVDMPEDSGASGQEIYEDTCASCHGGDEDSENAAEIYTLFVEPGGDQDAALAEFMALEQTTLVNNVAFGAVGFYEDGTPYANMPAYHEELSLAEVRRVVEHLEGLEVSVEEIKALGINSEVGDEE